MAFDLMTHPYFRGLGRQWWWLAAVFMLLLPKSAFAQLTIKQPGNHPMYGFEAEPHIFLAPFDDTLGAGFRGTVPVVDNGFIKTINNSVGVGFGVDFSNDHIWFPVVMQWNFFLSDRWSVFGEPGIALHRHQRGRSHTDIDPLIIYAGGRLHFNDTLALTLRVGRPTVSLGLSILL
jgi:hypothetical protein